MICSDTETALIERISARKLIDDRLSGRQRRLLGAYYRQGKTLVEIGKDEGCGPERVRQVINASLSRLRRVVEIAPPAQPAQGFDRRAFLDHMRLLKARKALDDRLRFADERAALDEMLRADGLLPSKPTTHHLVQTPKQKALWLTAQHEVALQAALQNIQIPAVTDLFTGPAQPAKQYVEPEFDAGRLPVVGDLHCIAAYALGYLLALRQWTTGLRHLGKRMASVTCPRDADRVAEAMMAISRSLPSGAVLSAIPLDVPAGLLGVGHTTPAGHVAMRIASIDMGRELAIDLTWDEPE